MFLGDLMFLGDFLMFLGDFFAKLCLRKYLANISRIILLAGLYVG